METQVIINRNLVQNVVPTWQFESTTEYNQPTQNINYILIYSKLIFDFNLISSLISALGPGPKYFHPTNGQLANLETIWRDNEYVCDG